MIPYSDQSHPVRVSAAPLMCPTCIKTSRKGFPSGSRSDRLQMCEEAPCQVSGAGFWSFMSVACQRVFVRPLILHAWLPCWSLWDPTKFNVPGSLQRILFCVLEGKSRCEVGGGDLKPANPPRWRLLSPDIPSHWVTAAEWAGARDQGLDSAGGPGQRPRWRKDAVTEDRRRADLFHPEYPARSATSIQVLTLHRWKDLALSDTLMNSWIKAGRCCHGNQLMQIHHPADVYNSLFQKKKKQKKIKPTTIFQMMQLYDKW